MPPTRTALKLLITFTFGLLAIPIVLAVAIVGFTVAKSYLRYDRSDPDFRWINNEISEGRPVDWTQLSGGNWQTVCVVGGYEEPLRLAHSRNGRVARRDEARFQRHEGLLSARPVEEFEMVVMIFYPDREVRFIRMPNGYPEIRQREIICIDDDDD